MRRTRYGMAAVRIIFLDFDGVLNHIGWLKGRAAEWRGPFDPSCVLRVARIADQTSASIVVSSSWREKAGGFREREQHLRRAWLAGLLSGAGWPGAPIVGVTPVLSGMDRGILIAQPRSAEIAAWLQANADVDAFVILDDDEGAGISDRFVQTSFDTGITDADADRAIQILGTPLPGSTAPSPREAFT